MIVLIKENRKPQALLIIIPLLVASLLWIALKALLHISSSQVYLFDLSFASLIVAISVLMLMAHKRAGANRFTTFLWAVVLVVFIGAIIFLSYSGLAFSRDMIAFIVFYAVGIIAVLIGLVFVAHCCRKYYSPIRFTLWLAVCTPAGAILVMLIYASIVMSIMVVISGLPSSWYRIFAQMLVVGLVLGGILYAVQLPFLILALSSSFFRKRFYECFRLKGMIVTPDQVSASGPDNVILTRTAEKNTDAEDKISNKWMDPPRPKD